MFHKLEYLEKTIDGIIYKAVKVVDKEYIPFKSITY